MFRLLRYMRKREWMFASGVLFFVVCSVFLTLKLPDYMTKVTRLVETGGAMNDILKAGAIMIACAIGDACCSIMVSFCASQVSCRFSTRVRDAVYTKVVGFSMEEIGRFSTASLITRSTNDITQVVILISQGMQAFLRAPIIAIWAFVKILGKGWEWMIVVAIAVVIVAATIGSNMILVIPKFRMIQKLTDNLNKVARELLSGIRVVRAYNAESYQENKYDTANVDLRDNHLYTGRIMAFMPPTINIVMSATSLAIYWVGAHMIQGTPMAGRVDLFSQLVTFMAYAANIIMAFMMVSMIFIMLPRAMVAAGRLNEVLDTETKVVDGAGNDNPYKEGKIEFRNVSFQYPDAEEKVLENITFTAEPGETVAFIGSTGSGKSTLINLVPRFYDVTEGEVLVDGVNVKEYTQHQLHHRIGYIAQKAVLFKGTIKSNIEFGHDSEHEMTDEWVTRALTIAQGKDILDKEEKGLYTEVAQGGTNFSGGQKQRISIARAIAKDPEIYIFDDSFSALDYKTDKTLRATLKKETQNATTLIVAQRIGTVRDADKIVVLDEGKAVGIGTHDELMQSCDVYREIAFSQLSEEELANA